MNKNLIKVQIDNRTWLRANSVSFLLRKSDGKKCCLGFACEVLGVPLSVMENVSEPFQLIPDEGDEILEKKIDCLLEKKLSSNDRFADRHIVGELMLVNDSTLTTDEEKRSRIKKLFPKLGLEAEFIN